MAKKKTQPTRKAPRASTPRMYGDGAPPTKTSAPAQPAARPAANGAATTTRPAATGGRGSIPMEQQYAYVMGDLKRLGMVALGMFGFLIALGVILR